MDDNTKNIQYTDHLSTRDISDPGTIDPYNNHWYIKANGDSSNIYKFSDTFAKSTLKTMIFKQKKLIELPHFVNNYLIINSLYGDTFISSAINPIGKSFDSLILDGPIGKIIPCECGHLVITRKHSNQIFGISYLPKSLFLIDSSGVRTKILDLSNCPILVLDNFPRIYSQLNAFVYFNLGEFGNFHYASLGLDSICKSNTSNNSSRYIIYPNPSSERLYSNKDVSKLNVFNSVGQKMSIHIKIDDSNRKYLDLVNYSKGIYFVGFENTYIKYFILQN
ncbi:MAG: T9SS type A sorting domain-containing protein [Bacteroidetes bacterium]|nr:T9SS type A sorting domain-containing protein [Bacteroidota bacterium]